MKIKRLKNNGLPELKLNALQQETKKLIEKKIETGSYKFESIFCPVCGLNDKELIGEKDRYGLFFSTNLCRNCGFLYTSPRMTQDSYNQFYNSEYRRLYGGKEAVNSVFLIFRENLESESMIF